MLISKYKKYIFISIGIIILTIFAYIYNQNNVVEALEDEPQVVINETKEETIGYVDIKGQVKKPGVISFKEGERVIDAIEKAGGLTKNATTANINLSQKLKNEMVIYIFSKSELTTKKTTTTTATPCKCETIEINNCINNEETNNSLININTASLEQLQTLPGIGESKAKAIISYRTDHGNFNTIEDIKNVSGLGDALFDKIKDYITV